MKRFFVIAILLSAVALMQAQGKFQLGVKTGSNSTSFNTEAGYDFASAKDDFKTGYLVGAWTRIHLLGGKPNRLLFPWVSVCFSGTGRFACIIHHRFSFSPVEV